MSVAMMIVVAAATTTVVVVMAFKYNSFRSIFLLHCRFLIRNWRVGRKIKKIEKKRTRKKNTYSEWHNTHTHTHTVTSTTQTLDFDISILLFYIRIHMECAHRNVYTKWTNGWTDIHIHIHARFVACQSVKICCFTYYLFFLYLSWFCHSRTHHPLLSLSLSRSF